MIVFLITIFILGVGMFVLAFITPQIFTGLKTAGINSTSTLNDAINTSNGVVCNTINTGFLILFVGLILSMFITSFLVRTHPIFLFLYFIILVITILLAVYLGNTYYTMETNGLLAGGCDSGFINDIMNYIVEITVAVGIVTMVIIFAKFSTFGGTQPL